MHKTVTDCVLNFGPSDLDDLTDIKSEVLDVASDWKSFGEALHTKPASLDEINLRCGGVPRDCLSCTLTEFLRKNYDSDKYGVPSWKLIGAAVGCREGENNRDLALKIAENHPTTKGTDSNNIHNFPFLK